jgi:hypothetical protein
MFDAQNRKMDIAKEVVRKRQPPQRGQEAGAVAEEGVGAAAEDGDSDDAGEEPLEQLQFDEEDEERER